MGGCPAACFGSSPNAHPAQPASPPRVILHSAVSVDGRTGGFPIDLELFYSLTAEWDEDATLVGCDTLLQAHDPKTLPTELPTSPLPEPIPDDDRPLLVVPDSRGRFQHWGWWLEQPYWRGGVLLASERTPADHCTDLERRGLAVVKSGRGRVDLGPALVELQQRFGVATVRVDSGGILSGVLLREGLADELSLRIHPVIVGGAWPRPFFVDPLGGVALPRGQMKIISQETLPGGILWLRYDILPADSDPPME